MKRLNRHHVMLAVLVSLLIAAAVPAPSQASIVTGCHLGFCVDVDTGGKNYGNHTQWVGNVSVYLGVGNVVEAWGDGFYARAWGQRASWWVNRWVRSGTYVCGATNINGSGGRKIACIAIRV